MLKKYPVSILLAACIGAITACAPTGENRARGDVIVDDAHLTARVKTALAQVEGLSAFPIYIIAKSGEVTLSGSVGDEEMIRQAVETAGSVPRVVRVHND